MTSPEGAIPAQFLKGSGLAKLIGGRPRACRTFDDFAGAGGRFQGTTWCLWALSGDDLMRAGADAYAHCRDVCKWPEESLLTGDGRGMLNLATKAFHLALALRTPEKPEDAFAKDGAEVLREMDPDEIGALYERFLDWQAERSAFAKVRAWEEVEAFVDALGKGQTSPAALLQYDSTSLRFMLTCTAERLHRQTTPRSSGTTPPTDSTSGSPSPTT